tara:strand:+ start:345 stop:857 length:513 start_codon:yes stop_codon:yes gene_type:complete
MNKKAIALWNITIIISVVITMVLLYNNYQSHQTTVELWEEFENQEIGTDKILQNKVQKIENDFMKRENYKFVIDESPTELSNVIAFDGFDPRFAGSSKYIYVTAIITSPSNNKHKAIVKFRDMEYTVETGDSIAGGLIASISEKEVEFNKNGKSYNFYKGLDSSINENKR